MLISITKEESMNYEERLHFAVCVFSAHQTQVTFLKTRKTRDGP